MARLLVVAVVAVLCGVSAAHAGSKPGASPGVGAGVRGGGGTSALTASTVKPGAGSRSPVDKPGTVSPPGSTPGGSKPGIAGGAN
jgi:hypothetical protein